LKHVPFLNVLSLSVGVACLLGLRLVWMLFLATYHIQALLHHPWRKSAAAFSAPPMGFALVAAALFLTPCAFGVILGNLLLR
jgi:hypothetical protein